MIGTLLRRHQIRTVTVDPAMVFLQAGKQTTSDMIDRLLLEASLRRGMTMVVFKRCHELLPMDSDDEHLAHLIWRWICHQTHSVPAPPETKNSLGNGNIYYLATTTRSVDRLHCLWRGAFASQCHLTIQPESFASVDRCILLKRVFLAEANLVLEEEDIMRYTGGFLPCDLQLLAKRLACDRSADIRSAAAEIRDEMPASRRTSLRELEPVSWNEIYGQTAAKEELILLSHLLTDLAHRQLYVERGLEWPRGVILHGPPGTGKTKLARAMAYNCQAHFMALSLSELVHAEIGASEAALKDAFATARRLQPAIIFVDELDALVSPTGQGQMQSITAKLMVQLCEEMDELERGPAGQGAPEGPEDLVLVLGATNLLESLPPALLQYGRFGMQLFIGPLTVEEQAQMIGKELSTMGMKVSVEELIPLLGIPASRTGAQVAQLLDQLKVELFNTSGSQENTAIKSLLASLVQTES